MSPSDVKVAEAIFAQLQAATGDYARRGEIAHAQLLASAVILIGALQAANELMEAPADGDVNADIAPG